MGSLACAPLIAIFNSRNDVIEAVRVALQAEGFATATAHVADIQSGTLDLVATWRSPSASVS